MSNPTADNKHGLPWPVTFHDAFEQELERIKKSRTHRLENYPEDLDPRDSLTGLAFSGGGIRSATFNLGVLQALAREKLLSKFDYLSTVSGGGYIGSWLAALTKRFMDEVPDSTFAKVEQALVPVKFDSKKRNEPTFLHWLRMYSNYLTPRKSLLSGDTWAMIGTWMRNTFLNQIILISTLVAVFLFCHAVFASLITAYHVKSPSLLPWVFIGAGGLGLLVAAIVTSVEVMSRFRGAHAAGTGAAAVLLSIFASVVLNWGFWLGRSDSDLAKWWWWPAAGAGFYFLAWALGTISGALFGPTVRGRAAEEQQGEREADEAEDARADVKIFSVAALLISSPIAGAVGAVLLSGYFQELNAHKDWLGERVWMVAIFGPAVLALVLLMTATLHIGLIGRGCRDLVREWWARLGGLFMLYGIVGLLLATTWAFGPLLMHWAIFTVRRWKSVPAVLLWFANNYFGLKFARSEQTSGQQTNPAGTASNTASAAEKKASSGIMTQIGEWLKSPKGKELVAKVAPYVFAFGLVVLVATAVQFGTGWFAANNGTLCWWHLSAGTKAGAPTSYWGIQQKADAVYLLIAAAAFLGVAFALSLRMDVNDFSLHRFYRNRLVRCYLGASNPGRSEHDYAGFDFNDDIPLDDFAEDYRGPYPILNATLNLTSGKDLGYSTRRGKSFVFTPLYCGFDHRRLGNHADRFVSEDHADKNYTPSYALASDGRAREEPPAELPETKGLTLGTAMAISGAAACPNMGYFSSPATAFFMTLFDVRLGWWMGNPQNCSAWGSRGPRLGFRYLLSELGGQSDQDNKYVYLSDGGHFENLGVYELIKRRCKLIVACDASTDPHYKFDDLINLIEKARADFGARVEINFEDIRPKTGRETDQNFAVGTIYYDPEHPNDTGKLIYVKSSLPARDQHEPSLPEDARHYADLHPAFPHESLLHQWFDELQFESYRALGEFIGRAASDEIKRNMPHPREEVTPKRGVAVHERVIVVEHVTSG
jgi:hypothetical protein